MLLHRYEIHPNICMQIAHCIRIRIWFTVEAAHIRYIIQDASIYYKFFFFFLACNVHGKLIIFLDLYALKWDTKHEENIPIKKKQRQIIVQSFFICFRAIKSRRNIKYQRAIVCRTKNKRFKMCPKFVTDVTREKNFFFCYFHRFIRTIAINKLKSECIQLLSVHIM